MQVQNVISMNFNLIFKLHQFVQLINCMRNKNKLLIDFFYPGKKNYQLCWNIVHYHKFCVSILCFFVNYFLLSSACLNIFTYYISDESSKLQMSVDFDMNGQGSRITKMYRWFVCIIIFILTKFMLQAHVPDASIIFQTKMLDNKEMTKECSLHLISNLQFQAHLSNL